VCEEVTVMGRRVGGQVKRDVCRERALCMGLSVQIDVQRVRGPETAAVQLRDEAMFALALQTV
jgi:hypothetical protein